MGSEIRDTYLDPEVLSRVGNYSLLARKVVEGFLTGLHRSMYHGFGSEFVQYRNYSRGDDLKYVDWKVYARLDRIQTKVFEEETNTNCYIVLDCSASMGYQGERSPLSKLHYGKIMAACLAYLVQRQGDNVGLYAYADRLRTVIAPGHKAGQVHRLCVELAKLQAEGGCDHQRVLTYLGEHFNRRGLLIYISDFLDAGEDLFKALRRFRFQHHDCILFHLLDPDELDLHLEGTVRFVDSESGEEIVTAPAAVREQYQRAMQRFVDEIEGFATGSDLDYHRILTDQPLAGILAAYLHRRELFQ